MTGPGSWAGPAFVTLRRQTNGLPLSMKMLLVRKASAGETGDIFTPRSESAASATADHWTTDKTVRANAQRRKIRMVVAPGEEVANHANEDFQ